MEISKLFNAPFDWAKRQVGRMSIGRQELKTKLVTRDPTRGYRPQRFFHAELLVNNLPLYTLWSGRLMINSDPLVTFSLNVRDAALSVAEIDIRAKDERLKKWLEEQWHVLWEIEGTKIRATKRWGFAGIQPIYKMNKATGLIEIERLKDFAPEDVRPLEADGELCGFRVKDRRLFGPEALWLTFGEEYGNLFGRGCLRRMYPYWYIKWMDHGAEKLVQERMMKDAYIGDIFWYPENLAAEMPDGTQVSFRDLFRSLGENRMTGGSLTLPKIYDTDGRELTGYTPPQSVAGSTDLFQWVDVVNEQIMRGADVPVEVVKASETGSGYSGRSIPFMVLLAVCNLEFVDYVRAVEKLLREVAWLNFGGDPDFELRPKSLVESFAKDASGSPMGGGAVGGQPGQVGAGGQGAQPGGMNQPPGGERTAWVDPQSGSVRFDEESIVRFEDDGRWITVGGRKEGDKEHAGGFPVQIDANGVILKSGGPKGLEGKNISNLKEHFDKLNTQSKSERFVKREQEKTVNPRSGYRSIVKRQAAKHKITEEEYEALADEVWRERLEQIATRESAKRYLRNAIGINSGTVNRLENKGFDYSSDKKELKNIDVYAAEVASMYPELGWGSGAADEGSDYSALAWDLIREGKQEIPARTSQEYHDEVGAYIAGIQREGKRLKEEAKKKKAKAAMDFEFGKNVVDFDELHSYSSTQFNLPGELAFQLRQMGDRIDHNDLAGDGRELNPHITVKYGLHTNDAEEVRKVVQDSSPVAVTFGKTSTFPGSEHDVIKIEIESVGLHQLNEAISEKLHCTDTHPEYKPHCTIAYVKPGLGEKYAETLNDLQGKVAVFDRLIFSDKSRTHTSILLTGKSTRFEEPTPPSRDEIAELGSRAARERIRAAAAAVRAASSAAQKKTTELADSPLLANDPAALDLLTDIEALITELSRDIFSDLQASMLAGQLAGAAEVVVSVPPALTPPAAPVGPPRIPPTPPTLAALFPDEPPRVTFPVIDDALEVLTQAEVFTDNDYRVVAEQVKQGAFGITSDLEAKAVADVRDILAENIAKGANLEDFTNAVVARLENEGPLSESHIETIFRTNVNAAFSNGANKSLEQPMVTDAFPYRAYFATTDQRVRHEHIALEKLGLNGTNIYRADDPTWQKFRPPWDYNCRCSWTPVSVEQAARRGVKEAQDWWERARAMRDEVGEGRIVEYLNRTAPSEREWVTPPPFEPSPEFRREI